jgi:hypothetical protein
MHTGVDQEVADEPGGTAKGTNVVIARVQVEDEPIRSVGIIGPAQPDVRGETALVGEVDQRGCIVTHDVGDRAALLGHGGPMDPAREVG